MNKRKENIFRVSLVILIASIFAGFLLITKLSSFANVGLSFALPAPIKCSQAGYHNCKSGYSEPGGAGSCKNGQFCKPYRNEMKCDEGYCFVNLDYVCHDSGQCNHVSTPTPTAAPTSTPVSTPTATPTPESTPTPSAPPNWCGGTCGSNSNCQNGLFCYQGYCRNPSCPGESSCGCVLSASTPPQLPKTGSDGITLAVGLAGIGAAGIFIFRKFKLI